MKTVDLPWDIKLDQSDNKLSAKLSNLGVVFDEKFTLMYQVAAIKKKSVGGLIVNAKISMFIHREYKLRVMHCLIQSKNDFGNDLLYGLPNRDLHGLQTILNGAERVIVNLPGYSTDKVPPRAIELHFLPVKPRKEFHISLLAHKSLL